MVVWRVITDGLARPRQDWAFNLLRKLLSFGALKVHSGMPY
jgi:hypothetical protein